MMLGYVAERNRTVEGGRLSGAGGTLETYAGYTRCARCGIYDRDPAWCDLCGKPKDASLTAADVPPPPPPPPPPPRARKPARPPAKRAKGVKLGKGVKKKRVSRTRSRRRRRA